MLNTYLRLVCKTYPWSDASTIRQKLYLLFYVGQRHTWRSKYTHSSKYRRNAHVPDRARVPRSLEPFIKIAETYVNESNRLVSVDWCSVPRMFGSCTDMLEVLCAVRHYEEAVCVWFLSGLTFTGTIVKCYLQMQNLWLLRRVSQNCDKRLFASLCLSVRPRGTTRISLGVFSRNWYLRMFLKICR
jgi:hypothetical protein